MKKYVSCRTQPSKNSTNTIYHDLRIKKPSYLKTDKFHNQFANEYFGFTLSDVSKRIKESWNNYNEIFRENHKAKYGKYRNLKEGKQSDVLTWVVFTSNTMEEDLQTGKLSKDEITELYKQSALAISKKINEIAGEEIEVFNYALHFDETTPHLHINFANHTSTGQSVNMLLKNSGKLSEFQDIVADTWKNTDYKRGEQKSEAKHLNIHQMHQKEKELQLQKEAKELKELKKELEQIATQKEELRNEIKVEIKELQKHKKELKATSEDKAELKAELDQIDKTIKSLREKEKEQKQYLEELNQEFEENNDDIDWFKEKIEEQREELIELEDESDRLQNLDKNNALSELVNINESNIRKNR